MKTLIKLATFLSRSKHPFPEHLLLSRKIAAEGMVVLKNENQLLPLRKKRVALFGPGSVDTSWCGTGSGYVFVPYHVNIEEGLRKNGIALTSKSYLKRLKKEFLRVNRKDKTISFLQRFYSGRRILVEDIAINESELEEAKKADTAIYVLRRSEGENHDRKPIRGDYYLSEIEEKNLKTLNDNFRNIILLLNTCVIDLSFVSKYPNIKAILYASYAGNEIGNAVYDCLTGITPPDGRLTDTFAFRYEDYPAAKTFSLNDGEADQEDYLEDIFVGYRYFDTFNIEPLYPFGYGLSYTEFESKSEIKSVTAEEIRIKVFVKNLGKHRGRETIQVYVSAPLGKLVKPFQELKGFKKTKLLEPNESQILELVIRVRDLASYDMDRAAYVLEKGKYIIRVGKNSRASEAIGVINLTENVVTVKLANKAVCGKKMELLAPRMRPFEDLSGIPEYDLDASAITTFDSSSKIKRETVIWVPEGKRHDLVAVKQPYPSKQVIQYVRDVPEASFFDVLEGRCTLKEFVASLPIEVLLRFCTGVSCETKHRIKPRLKRKIKKIKGPRSSGSTTALYLNSLGIPPVKMTDGPAGLHIPLFPATCFPVALVLAQTWDPNLAYAAGKAMGRELAYYKHSVLLGPGMNIHRDPLGGRNFEYYSEDPLLTGIMGIGQVQGIQANKGCSATIKHFACNNQEEARTTMNVSVSERALREIYLKGFEMVVKEAKPKAVMSSYNKVNGIHTSSNYELLTDILRGEWGFRGIVMTDWGSNSTKPYDLHAGNDLIMGGYKTELLANALVDKEPEFLENGFVQVETFDVFGGFFKEQVEKWNSFRPCKEGKDTYSVLVKSKEFLAKEVDEYVKKGIALVKENEGGSLIVTYKGWKLGAYLSLGDVQKSAYRVLKFIQNSLSMEIIREREKTYAKILARNGNCGPSS